MNNLKGISATSRRFSKGSTRKTKKDKRRSRLTHLSNGADGGGISKLKEQTEIKHQ